MKFNFKEKKNDLTLSLILLLSLFYLNLLTDEFYPVLHTWNRKIRRVVNFLFRIDIHLKGYKVFGGLCFFFCDCGRMKVFGFVFGFWNVLGSGVVVFSVNYKVIGVVFGFWNVFWVPGLVFFCVCGRIKVFGPVFGFWNVLGSGVVVWWLYLCVFCCVYLKLKRVWSCVLFFVPRGLCVLCLW